MDELKRMYLDGRDEDQRTTRQAGRDDMSMEECPGCGYLADQDELTTCPFCGEDICYVCAEAPGHCGKAECEARYDELQDEEWD